MKPFCPSLYITLFCITCAQEEANTMAKHWEDSGGLHREQTLDQANKRAYSSKISYFKTYPRVYRMKQDWEN